MITSDICESVLVSLRKIIRAIDIHSKCLVQLYGITGPQLVVLKEIHRFNNEITLGVLAASASLSQATVTSIVDRLEKRGLVERVRSNADRRRVFVKLTDAGNSIIEKSPSLLQDRFVEKIMELKEWEQSLILSSLQRVVDMMEVTKEAADTSPILVSGPVSATVEESAEFLKKVERTELETGGSPLPSGKKPDSGDNLASKESKANDETAAQKQQLTKRGGKS
ncbi:MAG: MarR family winged helix-turn-helix transcriptional regulator [Nitrospinota bacterium]